MVMINDTGTEFMIGINITTLIRSHYVYTIVMHESIAGACMEMHITKASSSITTGIFANSQSTSTWLANTVHVLKAGCFDTQQACMTLTADASAVYTSQDTERSVDH